MTFPWAHQGKSYYDYQLTKARKSLSPGFSVKTTVLSGATCLVPNGNSISSHALPSMKAHQILKRDKRPQPVLVCCFACFAACDVKGRQITTGYGASCPWQQHDFNVKTWWPNFFVPYSTDNRSTLLWQWMWNRIVHIVSSSGANITLIEASPWPLGDSLLPFPEPSCHQVTCILGSCHG